MRKKIVKKEHKAYYLLCAASILTALLMLLTAVPYNASAHSLYIQSGRFQVSEGRGTPLFFCYGHHFPVDDAVRGKKLAYINVIAPDKSVENINIRNDKSLHSYVVEYEKSGIYALTAETTPGYFAMYIDKKGRKRHSLKPLNTFVDNAKEVLSSMKSSQWTKTYVVSGKPNKSFPANVGLPLELVPLKDITRLKIGDSVEFQVYNDGKLYTKDGYWDATYSGFSTESEDMYIQRKAIKNGKFTLPIDQSGRWFIRFFIKTDAPKEHKKEYLQEKRTSTLVFEVRNERKRPKLDSH